MDKLHILAENIVQRVVQDLVSGVYVVAVEDGYSNATSHGNYKVKCENCKGTGNIVCNDCEGIRKCTEHYKLFT